MASTLVRHHVRNRQAADYIGRESRPRQMDAALSHLVDELLVAFFVAMAVLWVVTTTAALFG